ncbi:NADH-quinone oxidoreductase subunit J [Streptomyces sp. NBC_00988]|uniref:NADH-quinone oxidoreductase subunit J family protein n=1 Tax=Streptomyces sp. NBC_00988 TaxID=2903704 RepID=UPI00386A191A
MTLAETVAVTATAPLAAPHTHGFLSPTGVEIAFLLVGLVTFGAALVTVTTKQLVHAALWLVVTLGGLAVEYLLLTAEFIAWVQVLIYVGSVVVLLLFGLMLTKAPIGRSPDADSGNRWAALAVAVAAAAALVWVVVDAFRATWMDLDGPAAGSTAVTGASLFQNWVLPFEALSVLLLAALVGAIVLSRKTKSELSSPPVNSRRATGSSPSVPDSRNHTFRRNSRSQGNDPTARDNRTERNDPTEQNQTAQNQTAQNSATAQNNPTEQKGAR